MLASETLLRPPRRYPHPRRYAMWPTNCLELMVAVAVIGIPRHVVARRVMLGEVASVERDDGAVWLEGH